MEDTAAKEKSLLASLQSDYKATDEQLAWCTPSTLDRYLRARKGVVRDAAKLLHSTLAWRQTFGVDTLNNIDFSKDIASGKMYVAGHDADGRPVMITRKRAERIDGQEQDQYLKYLVYSLESAAKAMQNGQEKWIWIMDLAGYSRANSPPISISMQVLHILADHYPERLEKCYVVDAPSVFWILFKALTPFIDHETRSKVVFVNGADMEAGAKVGTVPREHADFYSGGYNAEKYTQWLQQLWQ